MTAAIVCQDLVAGYGRKKVLHGIDLSVGPGEVQAVLGHNGAGKTTLLRCLAGLLGVRGGTVRTASGGLGDAKRTGSLTLVPAEGFVYPDLTVEENLQLSLPRGASDAAAERMNEAFAAYPLLADRRRLRAGQLSGGQQRMLSLGMALMRSPNVLLLDEPSLGLAPAIQEELFASIRQLAATRGMAVVLVEQNVTKALSIADAALVLHSGKSVRSSSAAEFLASDRGQWWELF